VHESVVVMLKHYFEVMEGFGNARLKSGSAGVHGRCAPSETGLLRGQLYSKL
jgi:hypothetical protein